MLRKNFPERKNARRKLVLTQREKDLTKYYKLMDQDEIVRVEQEIENIKRNMK